MPEETTIIPNQELTEKDPDDMIFNPIDLEASLGRIAEKQEDEETLKGDQRQQRKRKRGDSSSQKSSYTRPNQTRTSSKTPFLESSENTPLPCSESNNFFLKPYPISETNEVNDRRDLSNNVALEYTPDSWAHPDDQASMMEVTVMDQNDFVLSAEEVGSLNELDSKSLRDDPIGFWETPCVSASFSSTTEVPFSVTFSSSSSIGQQSRITDMDNWVACENDGDTDAAPIRSIDMEW